ncbi:hypothetical protein ACTFIW_000003 [Dictyostelium discoideum]
MLYPRNQVHHHHLKYFGFMIFFSLIGFYELCWNLNLNIISLHYLGQIIFFCGIIFERRSNFKSYEVGTIVAVHYSQKKLTIFSGKDYLYTYYLYDFDKDGYSVMWIGDGPIIKGSEECEQV